MIRGSTPTFTCVFPTDASYFTDIKAIFTQAVGINTEIPFSRMTVSCEEVSFTLTEEESSLFVPGVIELQLRAVAPDGTVLMSDIRRVTVRRMLPQDALYL